MKKQLMAMAVIGGMMTATAQAFVPLSNSQINLGSFRSNATRGMYYTELDIFSASPVEIGDTEGNYIYTNWSNLRTASNTNFPAGPGGGTYDAALGYSTVGNAGSLSTRFLTLGLSGQPLWFLPVVKGIRAGAAFQNSGENAGSYDWNSDGRLDTEWKFTHDVYTIVYTTTSAYGKDVNTVTDLHSSTNTTRTQWNAGAAWKGFILNDFDLGFSLARITNQNLLNSGGKRSYTDTLLDEQSAQGLGYPSGTRELKTYTATYAENAGIDVNSTSQTDLLAQARVGFIPFLTSVSGGVGVRVQRNDNPGTGLVDDTGLGITTFQKDGVDLALRDQVTVATGPLANFPTVSAYRVREATVRNAGTAANVDMGALDNLGTTNYTTPLISGPMVSSAAATTDFKDSRSGAGPLVRLEVTKKFEKVKVSLVGNFSSVKQTIDASQTLRYLSKDTSAYYSSRNTTWLMDDYTQTRTWAGSVSNRNLDGGVKFEFLAMDGVNLALGGFIAQNNVVSDITSATFDTTEKISYDDGDATSNNPLQQFTAAVRPSPITPGGTEGTWTQTKSRKITGKVDSLTTQISVPVGVEIPLSKKWTFRAGTRYVMQKAKSTVTTKIQDSKTVLVVSAAGATQATTTYTTPDAEPLETTVVTYPNGTGAPAFAAGASSPAETHFMEYSYGIQFDPTKSLSLAANAFLDTNPKIGNGAGAPAASILDLNTYRLLAIQAVFKF